MSQYFYLVATLPLLSFDQEHIPSSQEFLALCRSHLESEDFALLSRALLKPSGDTTALSLDYEPILDGERVVQAWLTWESRLRDELVRLRAQRLGMDASGYLSDAAYVTGVYEAAREAIGSASPLDGEELLDRARWSYLDELESGHFFDIARLIVYFLRLQLLERRALFDRERGKKRFGELYAAVMPESFADQFGDTNRESEE